MLMRGLHRCSISKMIKILKWECVLYYPFLYTFIHNNIIYNKTRKCLVFNQYGLPRPVFHFLLAWVYVIITNLFCRKTLFSKEPLRVVCKTKTKQKENKSKHASIIVLQANVLKVIIRNCFLRVDLVFPFF